MMPSAVRSKIKSRNVDATLGLNASVIVGDCARDFESDSRELSFGKAEFLERR
jgi:hypothetical protein